MTTTRASLKHDILTFLETDVEVNFQTLFDVRYALKRGIVDVPLIKRKVLEILKKYVWLEPQSVANALGHQEIWLDVRSLIDVVLEMEEDNTVVRAPLPPNTKPIHWNSPEVWGWQLV